MQSRKFLVGNLLFAFTVSAASVILYVQSTDGKPLMVIIDSISCNYIQGVLAGWKTGEYYHDIFFNTETETVYPQSRKGKIIRGIALTLASMAIAAPFAIATYNFTDKGLGTKIAMALAELIGQGTMNVFACAYLVDELKSTFYMATNTLSVSSLARCLSHPDAFNHRRDVYLLKNHIQRQILGFRNLLLAKGFEIADNTIDLSSTDLMRRFDNLCVGYTEKNLPLDFPEKSRTRLFVEYGFVKGFLGLGVINTALFIGIFGYTCDTETRYHDWGLSNIALSWLASNITMLPGYILSILSALSVVTTPFELLTDGIKPIAWALTGKLGFIPPIFMMLASIAISYKSGYTAERVFELCPDSLQSNFSREFVSASTAGFNSLWVGIALNLFLVLAIGLWGNSERKGLKAQIDLLEKVGQKFDGSLTNFERTVQEVLPDDKKKLSPATRNFLIGGENSPSNQLYRRVRRGFFEESKKPTESTRLLNVQEQGLALSPAFA